MAVAPRTAADLLRRYVAAHNAGIRTANFDALAALFAPEASFTFEGIAAGPFHGREAIRRGFAERPPGDEIVIRDVAGSATEVAAEYSWRSAPDRLEGALQLRAAGGWIAELRVVRGK